MLSRFSQYALCAAVEMAAARDRPVTVAEVARAYKVPPAALAKVFQQLVRAGLAHGTRGIGGGYRLARPRAEVTVLDVVSLFEPGRRDVWLDGDRGVAAPAAGTAPLRRLFDEVDEGVRATLASVSLDTLVRSRDGP
ncbi:MAG: Rrf2 family transcriptional regulator [Acidobacteriota bacterium]